MISESSPQKLLDYVKMLSGTPQKLFPICNVKYNATNLALSNLDNALY